jgi:hypothetical protein
VNLFAAVIISHQAQGIQNSLANGQLGDAAGGDIELEYTTGL